MNQTALAPAPDYIAVGHLCLDIVAPRPGGDPLADPLAPARQYTLGGTVVYGALTARALGRRVGIVTAAAGAVLSRFAPQLGGLVVVARDEGEHAAQGDAGGARAAGALPNRDDDRGAPGGVTVFENIYTPSGRLQYLRARAGRLVPAVVPAAWRETREVVHLGPLAQEFGPELAASFPHASLVGVTPQGWLREWDASGRVRPVAWPLDDARATLSRAHALVVSDEDVAYDKERLRAYCKLVRVVALTHGARGCTVFVNESDGAGVFLPCAAPVSVPAVRVDEVDPTGAGDVFAAAFFTRLGETGDATLSGAFANAAASFAVQALGTEGIPPGRGAVEARTAALVAAARV